MIHGGLPNTTAGVAINEKTAESISAVFTCLRVRAETMASIRTNVYELKGERKEAARSHKVFKLVSRRASKSMTAYQFWYVMQIFEDTYGNAFAYILRDRAGRPSEFKIWLPWEVEVYCDDEGNVWYKHQGSMYPQRDILHFFQNSNNGITGRSILRLNRETLGLAKKQENYAGLVYGEKPPMIFEGEPMDNDQALRISKNFKDHVSKGLVPWLMGAKARNIMLPPGDAQFIESRQFTKSDIYGMFRIPPYKLQNYSREGGATYSNVEQQNISFVTDVVVPAARAKEDECNEKLFFSFEQDQLIVEFDLSELLKGDTKTLKELIDSMLTRGVYSINEARRLLGLNPIPGGDLRYIQAGYVPIDKLDEYYGNNSNSSSKTNGHKYANARHQ